MLLQQAIVRYLRQPSLSHLTDVLLLGISDDEFGRYIGTIDLKFGIWMGHTNIGIIVLQGVEYIGRQEFESMVMDYPFILKYFSDDMFSYLNTKTFRHKEMGLLMSEEQNKRTVRG